MTDEITIEDLTGDMPYEVIQQALNDGDGSARTAEEVWTAIQAKVDQRVRGALRPRFTPPYADDDGILDTVRDAKMIFTLETLFNRRPYAQENPYTEQAKEALKNLRALGQSAVKAPVDSAKPRRRSVTVYAETAAMTATTRRRRG